MVTLSHHVSFYILCDLVSSSFLSSQVTMLLLLIQKIFRTKDGELSVFGRLAAGACAGMTSTLVIYFICLLTSKCPCISVFVRYGNFEYSWFLLWSLVFHGT
jgi:hypothetical protein